MYCMHNSLIHLCIRQPMCKWYASTVHVHLCLGSDFLLLYPSYPFTGHAVCTPPPPTNTHTHTHTHPFRERKQLSCMWTREQEEELAQLFERFKGDEGTSWYNVWWGNSMPSVRNFLHVGLKFLPNLFYG